MRKPLILAAALLASAALYLAVFSIVHRPLTTDGVGAALRDRSAYAKTLASPKLVVWAGSNGRYSHRCETLSQVTGLPCANLSVAMGVGLDIQLLLYEPLLHPGDTVYMPLEYGQYSVERDDMEGGIENAALVHDLQALLWSLEPRRIARAYGSFDLAYLIHGVIEMTLQAIGVQRRAGSTESTNDQGDVTGHSAALASPYADFLAKASAADPARPLPLKSHALQVIEAFVARSNSRGITVVAGLPTVPESTAIDDRFIGHLKEVMRRQGQHLLVLPNRSRYPLACFYDTLSHLHEECQVQHSQAVGSALLAIPALRIIERIPLRAD
jgi:hypothetical protein